MTEKRRKILFLYAILLIACFLGSILFFVSKSATEIHDHLSWDELNYETLARKGIGYNALEKNSLNFIAFYKIGKARADKDTLRNDALIKTYGYPDENLNPFYLRHYHPPLASYYWSLFINKTDIVQNDKNLRWSNVVLGIFALLALIISVYIGRRLSLESWLLLLSLAALLGFSPLFNYSFERLNFHTVQFICSLFFVAFLMRWVDTPTKRRSIVLGISVALMFLALETALFIVFGALVGLLLTGKLKQFLKSMWLILASFFASLVILWPGVVKTLAPVKTWIMYAARIFLKGNDEYAGVSMLDAWKDLYVQNWVIFTAILTVVVCASFLLLRNKRRRQELIPFIIALVYLLAITPFILNKTYVLPVIGLFIYAVVNSSNEWLTISFSKSKQIGAVIFGLITVFVLSFGVFQWSRLDYSKTLAGNLEERKEFEKELATVGELLADKQNVIGFNGQLLRYYLNDSSIRDMRKNQMANPGYYVREKGLYVNVLGDLEKNKIGAVVFPKEHLVYYPDERTKILETYNYKKIDLKHFRIFLSQKNNGY